MKEIYPRGREIAMTVKMTPQENKSTSLHRRKLKHLFSRFVEFFDSVFCFNFALVCPSLVIV